MLQNTLPFLLVFSLLEGCATYHPAPLSTTSNLAAYPTTASGKRLKALNLNQAAALAVSGNPQLAATRLKLDISDAELYQAGLLPDPQLRLSLDHPTSGGPGLVNAYHGGLTEDLAWLFTRNAKLSAARAARLQQRLNYTWKAWQISLKTQQLYIQLNEKTHRLRLLDQQHWLLAKQLATTEKALRKGDITRNTIAGDLVTLTRTNSRITTLHQQIGKTRIHLNALMGLQADARWRKPSLQAPTLPDSRQIRGALEELPFHRPDLLALRAGYRSSDARYRAAILGQFPALSIGFTRASDTSGIKTLGFGVILRLPFFNGNRGRIAIARATRKQLRAAYQARLDQAHIEVAVLLNYIHNTRQALTKLKQYLPTLHQAAQRATTAFSLGDLSGAADIAVKSQDLSQEQEVLVLQRNLAEGAIALRALLGYLPAGIIATRWSARLKTKWINNAPKPASNVLPSEKTRMMNNLWQKMIPGELR